MKTLKHLEKKKFVWFLIGLCTIFFLLRLPSLIEPNWYGDEGIYQVISLAMNNDLNLYTEIWDNKPPLLYATYALFSGDQFMIRLVSLLLGITAVVVFFFLSRILLQSTKAAGAAAIIFTLLFATPYIEGNIANAENFMLPLILTAAILIYRSSNILDKNNRHSGKRETSASGISNVTAARDSGQARMTKNSVLFLLLPGVLLGLAFLFKIVAVFDFAAFSLFLILSNLLKEKPLNKTIIHDSLFFIPLLSGFLIPILIAFLYFTFNGTLAAFIQAAFFGNIDYVGYGNHFIIPQGFLIIKVSLFAAALLFIIIKREAFTKPKLFIAVWFVFAVFSAFFSQRPYTHYLLVILPTFCLLAGLLFTKNTPVAKLRLAVLIISIAIVAQNYFHVYGIMKTGNYYGNALSFLSGQKQVKEYQTFFDPETPRDYEVVSYISTHTTPADKVFVWGDSPQIYYLSQKLPLNKYSVSYHVLQDPNGIAQTQAAIDKIQPKFIITLSEAPPLPFQLPNYAGTYGIKGAAIYERTF